MSKQRYTKLNEVTWNCTEEKNVEKMMQRLADLALDFNAGVGNNNNEIVEPIDPSNIIANVMRNDVSSVQEFNCEDFLSLCLATSAKIIMDRSPIT